MLRLLLPLAILAAPLVARAADAVDEALSPGLYEPRPASGTLAQVNVPFLQSPEMERRWGKPKLIVAADGSYVLTYQPKASETEQYFKIIGTRRPVPAIKDLKGRQARDGEATVLGRKTPWFEMGNETSARQSWGIPLTGPNGRTASYVLIYAGRKPWPGTVFPPVAW